MVGTSHATRVRARTCACAVHHIPAHDGHHGASRPAPVPSPAHTPARPHAAPIRQYTQAARPLPTLARLPPGRFVTCSTPSPLFWRVYIYYRPPDQNYPPPQKDTYDSLQVKINHVQRRIFTKPSHNPLINPLYRLTKTSQWCKVATASRDA